VFVLGIVFSGKSDFWE